MNDLFLSLQNNFSEWLKDHTTKYEMNEIIKVYNNMQQTNFSSERQILSLKLENDFKLLVSNWFSFSQLKLAFEKKEYFFILRKDKNTEITKAEHITDNVVRDLILNSISDQTLTNYILLSLNENPSQKLMFNFLLNLATN